MFEDSKIKSSDLRAQSIVMNQNLEKVIEPTIDFQTMLDKKME